MSDIAGEASQVGADPVGLGGSDRASSQASREFERLIRVAKSYALEADSKLDAIREAQEAKAEQVKGGTMRGTASAGLALGKLESEFERLLSSAVAAAEKARAADPGGEVEIEGLYVTADATLSYVADLRGKLEVITGESRKALAHFQEAIRLNPAAVASHFNAGLCLSDLSRPEEAKACFKRAVDLEPMDAIGIEAAKMLDHLEAGRVGQKHFRGSWKVVGVLALVAVVAFLFHAWLFFVGALAGAGAYFWWKFK